MATKTWIINDLVMDGVTPDEFGVVWSAAITGWNGAPSTRGPTDTRPNDDGEFDAGAYYNARLLNLVIWGDGPDEDTIEDAGSRLGDLLEINQDVSIQSASVSRPLTCTGTRTGELLVSYPHKGGISLSASAVVKCKDPRKYGLLETVSTRLPIQGGLIPPFVAPWVVGGSGGSVLVNNTGKYPTPGLITFFGPLSGPFYAINARDNRRLAYELDLNAGDYLTVDLRTGAVILNGSASRRSTQTYDSQRWLFRKGPTTVIFGAEQYSSGSMQIQYAPAYMV